MKHLLVFSLTLLSLIPARAERIISDLNFREGDWVLIGVPVHNYQLLPIQSELGTFIMKERQLLQEIQGAWDLDMTFDDNCDYHYELKFYRNGNLQRTLQLNLYCGYITLDGISYRFRPSEFERIRTAARPVDWSRISFGNLDILQKAIKTLDESREIYWYNDIKPYYYSGFFVLNIRDIPWDADPDSILQVISRMIENRMGSQDFYLQEYYTEMIGDFKQSKYFVYCEEVHASAFGPDQYIRWRSHFSQQDTINILAIGLNRRKYQELMQP